jgi:hypothetical protein
MLVADGAPPPGENRIKDNAFFGDTPQEMERLALWTGVTRTTYASSGAPL